MKLIQMNNVTGLNALNALLACKEADLVIAIDRVLLLVCSIYLSLLPVSLLEVSKKC